MLAYSFYYKNLTLLFLTFILFISLIICASNIEDNGDKMNLIQKEECRIINAMSGANMTSLLIEAGENNDAELKFGSLNNFYSFTARGKYRDFTISNVQRPVISINKVDEMMIFTSNVIANKGLTFTGDFKIRNVPQWKLVYEEDFSEKAVGWTNNTVTECGGIRMLGGYCQFGGGEVFKIFNNLPNHSSIKIQATYHFIDAWDTESGFMRINNGKDGEMQYAWVERYSAFIGNHGINVCGGRWPEGRFSSPIDVIIPHKNKSVKLGFGSTTEQDPCDESFGVSGIRIYIK